MDKIRPHKTLWEWAEEHPAHPKPNKLPPSAEDFLANQASPSTSRAYRRHLEALLQFVSHPPETVTSHDLIRYRRSFPAHLKPATVSLRISILRSFFRFLAEGGYRESNPAQVLKLPKVAQVSPYKVLDAAELRTLIAQPDTTHPRGIRDRAILLMLSVNALREAELVQLDREDLRWQDEYGVAVIRGKGSKVRVSKIVGTVREALRAWLEVAPETRGPVFTGIDGKRITQRALCTRSIRFRVKHYALSAGITRKVSPHALRHAAITHSLANGANILKVKELAGHASLTTTQRYLHVLDGLADSAADHNPLARLASP